MHIAEHCITDLASALVVAKALGQRHVTVDRKTYKRLWHEKEESSCLYGWCRHGSIAIFCLGSEYYNEVKEKWCHETNNT